MFSRDERIRIFCTDIGLNEPVKIGDSTVSVENTAGPDPYFLVIRERDTDIANQETGEKGRVHCFFFTPLSGTIGDNEFFLHKFVQNMSLDDFLKRVSIAEAKQIYPNSFFETEVRITNYKRLLTTTELDYLGKILENYDRLACLDKKIVDRSGKEHNFVIAKLTKPIIKPNVFTNSFGAGSVTGYTRGEFVLSDNGTILTGRFLIGGLESLRFRKIQETLDKNCGSNGRER